MIVSFIKNFFFLNQFLFLFLSNLQTQLLNSKKKNIEIFCKKQTNKENKQQQQKKTTNKIKKS